MTSTQQHHLSATLSTGRTNPPLIGACAYRGLDGDSFRPATFWGFAGRYLCALHEELDRIADGCGDESGRPCPCADDCLAEDDCRCRCRCSYVDAEYTSCRICDLDWRDQELAEEVAR
jgi:hypothetical protein